MFVSLHEFHAEFIKKHLEWHFDTFDNNDIRDFSDAFIEKMRKSKGTDNANFFQVI